MGDHNWKFQRSKEDQTQSIFVTNFPENISARDLWNACNNYGKVIDDFIPFKKSKAGKRFAFVRFIKVENVDRLVDKLCTIWLGRFRLHANVVRFQRESRNTVPQPYKRHVGTHQALLLLYSNRAFLNSKVKEVSALPNLYFLLENEGFQNMKLTHLGGLWVLINMDSIASKEKFGSWFSVRKPACNSFVCEDRIVWISIEGSPLKGWSRNTFVKVASKWGELVDWKDFTGGSFAFKRICVKTKVDEIINERFKAIVQDEDSDGEVDGSVHGTNETNDVDRDSREHSKEDDMSHPPGFTPKINNGEEEDVSDNGVNVEESNERVTSMPSKTDVGKQVTNEGVNAEENQERAKSTFSNFNQPLSNDDVSLVNFVALQETKMESMDLVTIKALWGNISFDYAYSPSVGNSGAVMGTWTPSSTKLLIISVYAPQELIEKKELWDYLRLLINRWEGEYVILGDFNEVRSEHERFGSVFNVLGFDKLVEDTWLNSNIEDSNDKILDQGGSSKDILNTRSTLLKELDDINTVDSLEMAQKAQIHWATEGDENSKYFHVKNEFLTYFSNRFSMPGSFRICLVEQFTNRLSSDQKEDLEHNVTLNEIKSPVWDCGTSKYHGSDGFTFEFFHRYWKFFEHDIMAAVTEFFSSGVFPSGCNSSFIALIPKIQYAKAVHDFLLDGPFILNELLSWCKHKKMKVMFFKWMSSVLVNGNPTTEFQFHKGLKQGDPLSPFLFILVMESLHLSFRRVRDAGLFSDDMALKHRYPRLYALELSKHISVSEKLSSDSLVFFFRRIPRGGIEEEQQRSLQARIEGIILAPMSDRWIWSYESSGEFSVKLTRSFIDDSLLPKEEVPIRWVNVIPI
nr:hypothetical protein [Tanacetum cinerariifolium]